MVNTFPDKEWLEGNLLLIIFISKLNYPDIGSLGNIRAFLNIWTYNPLYFSWRLPLIYWYFYTQSNVFNARVKMDLYFDKKMILNYIYAAHLSKHLLVCLKISEFWSDKVLFLGLTAKVYSKFILTCWLKAGLDTDYFYSTKLDCLQEPHV